MPQQLPRRSPFSFHCIICYEPFDQTERYPVVLPCGHTHICHPCSSRLKKCMECRTNLYHVVPKAPVSPNPALKTSPLTSRYRSPRPLSPGNSNAKPKPPQMEQIPLPSPKNLVLMTLMEAAQTSCVEVEEDYDDLIPYESGDDDEDVDRGIKFLTGTYGTYVVRAKNGLFMIPARHSDNLADLSMEGSTSTLERLSPLLFGSELESRLEESRSMGVPNFDTYDGPVTFLGFGEIVQVTNFQNEVARVARGLGFIKATSTQLVKVGPPTDRSCKLEGMIQMMAQEKTQLKKKLIELQMMQSSMRSELQEALKEPEEKPLQFIQNRDETENLLLQTPSPHRDNSVYGFSPPRTPMTAPVDRLDPLVIRETRSDPEARTLAELATSFTNEDESIPFREASNGSIALASNNSGCGCTFGLLMPQNDDDNNIMMDNIHNIQTSLMPRTRRRIERIDRIETGASDHIDFRTGLSGHMALSSARSKSERRLKRNDVRRSEVRMMSDHNGIASFLWMNGSGSNNNTPTK